MDIKWKKSALNDLLSADINFGGCQVKTLAKKGESVIFPVGTLNRVPEVTSALWLANFRSALIDHELSNESIREVLVLYRYHLFEEKYRTEIEQREKELNTSKLNTHSRNEKVKAHNITNRVKAIQTDLKVDYGEIMLGGPILFGREQSNGETLNVHAGTEASELDCKGPLRPTELLDRIIKTHKMRRDIIIPTMTQNGDSTSDASSARTRKHGPSLPRFGYEPSRGRTSNLPRNNELCRLLASPDSQTATHLCDTTHENNNSVLDLIPRPPLVEKKNVSKRQGSIVCKGGRSSPGDHQKWCVYYEANISQDTTDPKSGTPRTQGDNVQSDKLKDRDKSIPSLPRSKTSLEFETKFQRPDLPDYQSLHRDVYLRALADSRARLVFKKAHNFATQTTRPWVFSYFGDMKRGKTCIDLRKNSNEMAHIFGKGHTDFTHYYDMFVKAKLNRKKADLAKGTDNV
ncbi:hypothetical protein DPMN_177228 [Dreissena polymorpha]|uniref:Uncharacterized protein n=1 Tax=Dreissena polymorpha TaxID=45954 RepID=A0A9D4IHN3_DREPO|nr:hypothetical protein DPMN_177228 [Dreissena polymorpha]